MDIGNIAEYGIAGLGLAIGFISLGVLVWYMKANPKGNCAPPVPSPLPINGERKQFDQRIRDAHDLAGDAHDRLNKFSGDCADRHHEIDLAVGGTDRLLKSIETQVGLMNSRIDKVLTELQQKS